MLTANRLRPQAMPWRLFNQVQEELHRELNDWFANAARTDQSSVGLWTRHDSALVAVELPGRELSDIDVSVQRNVLTIEARPAAEKELPQGTRLVRREVTRGGLRQQLQLPFDVDPQSVDASFERGLLIVRLSAHESPQPAKIEVKAG